MIGLELHCDNYVFPLFFVSGVYNIAIGQLLKPFFLISQKLWKRCSCLLFLFIVLGILEVIHCVLVESPEALNIIKEEHITSIISLLDKHGRNHKVCLLKCMIYIKISSCCCSKEGKLIFKIKFIYRYATPFQENDLWLGIFSDDLMNVHSLTFLLLGRLSSGFATIRLTIVALSTMMCSLLAALMPWYE